MGARLFNSLLLLEHLTFRSGLRNAIHRKRLKMEKQKLVGTETTEPFLEMERITDLDAFVPGDYPVVLEGVAADWPCVQKWNYAFIQDQYGDDEAYLLFPDSNEYVQVTLREAIDRMQNDRSVNLRFQPLLQRHPELLDDLDTDFYFDHIPPKAKNVNYQFFMAKDKSFTPIHTAMQNLFFLQIQGEKEWIVYHPSDTMGMKAKVEGTPYFFSDFDPVASTHSPGQENLTGHRAILRTGDILYLPSFWWHYVRNLSDCISVGFRWTTLKSAFRASWPLSLLTLLANRPPIWVTMKDRSDFSKVVIKRRGSTKVS